MYWTQAKMLLLANVDEYSCANADIREFMVGQSHGYPSVTGSSEVMALTTVNPPPPPPPPQQA